MKVPVIVGERLEISPYHASKLKQAVKDNGGPIRAELQTLLPESRGQRSYCMGCIVPLIVYMDGGDYRDHKICEHYFEFLKAEFTPEAVKILGKIQIVGKSTKGSKALGRFIERALDYLDEQYGVAHGSFVTNVDEYKRWRDELSMDSTEDFLEYCIRLKHLK